MNHAPIGLLLAIIDKTGEDKKLAWWKFFYERSYAIVAMKYNELPWLLEIKTYTKSQKR